MDEDLAARERQPDGVFVTPYWWLAMRVSDARSVQGLWQRLAPLSKYPDPPVQISALLLMGLIPYSLFVSWMLYRVGPNADLQWRMWLASFWIVASPSLIVAWESQYFTMLNSLLRTAQEDHWNVRSIRRADAVMTRLFWPSTLLTSFGIGAGYFLSSDFFGRYTSTSDWSDVVFWLGLLQVLALGFSFGVGNWGVLKSLAVIWVALDRDFDWNPFNPRQVEGMEQISSFAYWTGILYSLGSVFLPSVYFIMGFLPFASQVVAVVVAGILIFGGAAVFILPTAWVYQRTQRQRENVLARYTAPLTDLSRRMLSSGDFDHQDMYYRVASLTTLRRIVLENQATTTAFGVATRVFALFLLPVLISVAQSFAR